MLAAHSLGLGTVHMGQFNAGKVAGVLEVPEGFPVVEMTPLGYPDQLTKSAREYLKLARSSDKS